MADIRSLRLSRGLTLIELALLADIPAGKLAELEHGRQPLDLASRTQLAHVFGMPAEQLRGAVRPQQHIHATVRWIRRSAFLVCAAIVGLAWTIFPAPSLHSAASTTAQLGPHTAIFAAAAETTSTPLASPTAPPLPELTTASLPSPTAPSATAEPATAPQSSPIPPPPELASTPPPSPTFPTPEPPSPEPRAAASRFTLAVDGPHGCPLAPTNGHVVLTQGYGEGSHAPAYAWGAIDLGIDTDSDGYAEPASSQGVSIAATSSGVAHVFLNSWPGGNFVRIVNADTGWDTAYAHLDSVAVTDGQAVDAGSIIGTTGSTGMATGPHLHYEVWNGGTNVDPTGLIECH